MKGEGEMGAGTLTGEERESVRPGEGRRKEATLRMSGEAIGKQWPAESPQVPEDKDLVSTLTLKGVTHLFLGEAIEASCEDLTAQ